MTAVAALPDLDLALFEDLGGLHVLKQGAIALLMVLLNGSHQTELGGQLREALLLGGLGKAVVHIRPLVVLALGGGQQVFAGGADAVMQLLVPHLSVLLLVVGGFQKQGGDLLKAVLFGLGSEIGVLVSGLGLAGEGGSQVLLGLGSSVFICHSRILL